MDKDEIIKEQRKTIALMKAHYELALMAVTDLEEKLGGLYPSENEEAVARERAERKEASFKRRRIPMRINTTT